MKIFSFNKEKTIGLVKAVDTSTVTVHVPNSDDLKKFQVNRIVILQSGTPLLVLIGLVTRITRKEERPILSSKSDEESESIQSDNDFVRVILIGTVFEKDGNDRNLFKRSLDTVPKIDAGCYPLDKDDLTSFMKLISQTSENGQQLHIGNYTLDDQAKAYLNGNKLFQRHALVVGSTGSGKSWLTAKLLEEIAQLPQANSIVLDIHGEYAPLTGTGFRHFKIAGPTDLEKKRTLKEGILHLPYWLLGYEAICSLFVDRSDQNAPNQTAQMTKAIQEAKQNFLEMENDDSYLNLLTIDSPIPYDLNFVINKLETINTAKTKGETGRERQGPYFDKLTRLLGRFEVKIADRRLGFVFNPPEETMKMDWLVNLVGLLIKGGNSQDEKNGGIKIIDFSEVPSDVIPLMVSLLANVIFTSNQWITPENRHPISLFCDEAHLYLPESNSTDSATAISVKIFERIAKEGRKFGVGLVVISQRPSEVNRTIMSQCNNVIAMRLTNGDDQNVVKRLLPDSLGGFGELLPILDTGEAIIVGDATILPTRVRVAEPSCHPNSKTISFWDEWAKQESKNGVASAVKSWRIQSQVSG